MGLTVAQKEVYDYCDKNDFVSPEAIETFKKRLQVEGNVNTLAYALEKFEAAQCPACNAKGAYKWRFLGKLAHPTCKVSWYVSPGTYIVRSLKAVFRAGVGAGGEMGFAKDKKGESGGWFGFLFGFLFGIIFRGIFAVITIPIQAAVSLSQKKS